MGDKKIQKTKTLDLFWSGPALCNIGEILIKNINTSKNVHHFPRIIPSLFWRGLLFSPKPAKRLLERKQENPRLTATLAAKTMGKNKAAKAAAARQEQRDREREKMRQKMKERMQESGEGEENSSSTPARRTPTPSETRGPSEQTPPSSPMTVDSGDEKKEAIEKKEDREGLEGEEDGPSAVSPNSGGAKSARVGAEEGVTWGGPSPKSRRKSLPLAQTKEKDMKTQERSLSTNKNLPFNFRTSGGASGRRTPSPKRERKEEKKKGKGKVSPMIPMKASPKASPKVSPRNDKADMDMFLAEALMREGTGKNIDQMAEIGWY